MEEDLEYDDRPEETSLNSTLDKYHGRKQVQGKLKSTTDHQGLTPSENDEPQEEVV